MAFTRAQLEAFRDAPIDDTVADGVRLLIVGINPSLWTAATGAPFARPGNRFYPALFAAGITDRVIDARDGFRPGDREHLLERGVGITNLVNRATVRADELRDDELVAGRARLERTVARWHPLVVAVAGISAYRVAFARPKAAAGRQPERVGDAELWVVPNPSGLNAHHTIATLAEAYAEPARAAGIELVAR